MQSTKNDRKEDVKLQHYVKDIGYLGTINIK